MVCTLLEISSCGTSSSLGNAVPIQNILTKYLCSAHVMLGAGGGTHASSAGQMLSVHKHALDTFHWPLTNKLGRAEGVSLHT